MRRISTSDLAEKNSVYTVNKEKEKVDISSQPFKKGEVDISLREIESVYNTRSKDYALLHGFKIAKSVKHALEMRDEGHKYMTIREADCAARGEVNLSSSLIHDSLFVMHGMIVEGIVGEQNSVWDLREYYNKGKVWIKEWSEKVNESRMNAANARMEEILNLLKSRLLPAWPEEVEFGFNIELTKPEFMTFDQYRKARMQRRTLFSP